MKKILLIIFLLIPIFTPGSSDQFFIKARIGDLEGLKVSLTNDLDINKKDNWGNTALFYTAEQSKINIAEYLLQKGANVNSKTNKGFTPLHMACVKNDYEMVKLLIDFKADLNVITKHPLWNTPAFTTPLSMAYDKPKLRKMLLRNGADGILGICKVNKGIVRKSENLLSEVVDKVKGSEKVIIYGIEKRNNLVKIRTPRGKTGWIKFNHIAYPKPPNNGPVPIFLNGYLKKSMTFNNSDGEVMKFSKGASLNLESMYKNRVGVKKDITIKNKTKSINLSSRKVYKLIERGKKYSTISVSGISNVKKAESIKLDNHKLIFNPFIVTPADSNMSLIISKDRIRFDKPVTFISKNRKHKELLNLFYEVKKRINNYNNLPLKNVSTPLSYEEFEDIRKTGFDDYRYQMGELLFWDLESIDECCGFVFTKVWGNGFASEGEGTKNIRYLFGNFGYFNGLVSGMTRKEVKKILGKSMRSNENVAVYSLYMGDMILYFEKGKLFAIALTNSMMCC